MPFKGTLGYWETPSWTESFGFRLQTSRREGPRLEALGFRDVRFLGLRGLGFRDLPFRV